MSEINIQDISKAIDDILTEYLHSSFDVRQKAVQAGAEKFKEKIETVTPRDTGEMARSWKIKTKYPDVRYVGNTRVATGKVRRKSKGQLRGFLRSCLFYSGTILNARRVRFAHLQSKDSFLFWSTGASTDTPVLHLYGRSCPQLGRTKPAARRNALAAGNIDNRGILIKLRC